MTRITPTNLHLLQRMVFDVQAVGRDLDATEPWMTMIVNGAAVTTCYSVRLTDRAAEARVDTLEGHRGRGYATSVVAAWAVAVRQTGRIPLYGTSWDNHASQAVARKIGLIQYGAILCLE